MKIFVQIVSLPDSKLTSFPVTMTNFLIFKKKNKKESRQKNSIKKPPIVKIPNHQKKKNENPNPLTTELTKQSVMGDSK